MELSVVRSMLNGFADFAVENELNRLRTPPFIWCTADWPHSWISQHQLVPNALVHHLTQLLKSRIRVPVGAVHCYLLTLQEGLLPLQFPDDL